jgi:hypothetical protein
MKLYVPEIGDQIKLTKDWKFTLHAEGRNTDLGKFHGYSIFRGGWVDDSIIPPMREHDYEVIYPPKPKSGYHQFYGESYDTYNRKCREAEQNNPEYVKWHSDFTTWMADCDKIKKDVLVITVPKGSILGIDRIYIRKGAKDYSSITFFLKGLPPVAIKNRWSDKIINKKALRFWAKLADCNTINFEQT